MARSFVATRLASVFPGSTARSASTCGIVRSGSWSCVAYSSMSSGRMASGFVRRRRGFRGERLLEQSGHVAVSVRAQVPFFERPPRARVGRVESQELLVDFDCALVRRVALVREVGRLAKDVRLLGTRLVRRRARYTSASCAGLPPW